MATHQRRPRPPAVEIFDPWRMTKIAATVGSGLAVGIGIALVLACPDASGGFWLVFGIGTLIFGGAVWGLCVAVGTVLDHMRAKAYAYRTHARQILHSW